MFDCTSKSYLLNAALKISSYEP